MSFNLIYEKKTADISGWNNLPEDKNQHCLRCVPHLHQELEIVYLRHGKTVAYADSVRYQLSAGDLFFTFPNQVHSYETVGLEDYTIFIIKPGLMPELEKEFTYSIPTSAVLHHVDEIPQIPFLISRIYDLVSKKSSGSYDTSLKKGYLLALYSEIFNHIHLKGMPKEDFDTLRTILNYCSQNYTENLSLSSLEETLHLNKYYISHLFGGKLGMSFNDYLHSLRIAQACRYLSNSSLTVTEISSLVGYETLRTFNRAFVKQLSVTPSQYRKINTPVKQK